MDADHPLNALAAGVAPVPATTGERTVTDTALQPLDRPAPSKARRRPARRGAAWTLTATVALAGLTLDAAAQLNRAQAGRVEVAKCYQTCTLGSGQDSAADLTRLILDALDGEWNISDAQLALLGCGLFQSGAIGLEACRAGCTDIEAAYNVRESHVRSRFYRLFNEVVRPMKTSGLWTAWNRYPQSGTDAFARACARYLQITGQFNTRNAAAMLTVEPLSVEEISAKRQEVIESEHRPEPPPFYESWHD